MVSSKDIHMKDKRIKAIKKWSKPQSIRDIQMFLGFANFYRQFIQRFSWTAALFTLILKTSRSIKSTTRPGESVVGVDIDSRAGCDGSKLDGSEIDDGEAGGGEVDDKVRKKGQKTSKSKKLSNSKKTVGSLDIFTPRAKLAFNALRQAFFKAPILHHFDLKCHIRIEMYISGYTINEVLSQLTPDNLGQ